MNSTSVLILSAVSLLSAVSAGCSSPDEKLARSVIRMTPEERRATLSHLRPETEIYVYTYAYTRNEPPLILASEIAPDWKSVLPVLSVRLKSERNEAILAGLIMVLPVISEHYCSLSGRDDILSAASQAATKLEPPYRELADKQIEEIRRPDAKLPPCTR